MRPAVVGHLAGGIPDEEAEGEGGTETDEHALRYGAEAVHQGCVFRVSCCVFSSNTEHATRTLESGAREAPAIGLGEVISGRG